MNIDLMILKRLAEISLTGISAEDIIRRVPTPSGISIILIESTVPLLNLILFIFALIRPSILSPKSFGDPEVRWNRVIGLLIVLLCWYFGVSQMPMWNDEWDGTYSFKGAPSSALLLSSIVTNASLSAFFLGLAIEWAKFAKTLSLSEK